MSQAITSSTPVASLTEAAAVQRALRQFLRPLLTRLAGQMDVRLVRTLRDAVEAIVRVRNRPQELWLTELGALLLGAARAPAGVKRLSRLLHAAGWTPDDLEQGLLEQADALLARQPVGEALVILDESVAEKPESLRAEGLCRVRSSKSRRLARPRRGFGGGPPPARPITVPGIHWLAATLTGLSGATLLACCRWWSPTAPPTTAPPTTAPGVADAELHGQHAQGQTATEGQLVRDLMRRWGRQVLFVADRGFARRPFLDQVLARHARCVIRWPKRARLVLRTEPALPAWTATNAWRLTAGPRKPWGHETIWDPKRRERLTVACFAVPVWLPDGPGAAQPLWLVVSRGRRGTEPWRLLTNEPIHSAEDARRIVRVYARRWQVECAFRFGKSDLGVESVRVRDWEHRRKLLGLLTLAYAFLVHLLATQPAHVRCLLRLGCHRTGRHADAVATPLYRLHAALAFLLAVALPPPLAMRPST